MNIKLLFVCLGLLVASPAWAAWGGGPHVRNGNVYEALHDTFACREVEQYVEVTSAALAWGDELSENPRVRALFEEPEPGWPGECVFINEGERIQLFLAQLDGHVNVYLIDPESDNVRRDSGLWWVYLDTHFNFIEARNTE